MKITELRVLIGELLEDKRFPFVLIFCGIALSAFGAAGVVPYLIPSIDGPGRIVLVVLGGLIVILGVVIYLMPGTSQPKLHSVSKFKFRITYPQTGSVQTMFNGFFDISGTYMKDPPEGYSVAIIELIEPSGFAFRRNVILDTQNKTWQAKA